MKQKKKKDWLEQKFPTARAREAADKAIEPLASSLPMTEFIDTWYIAYVAAGGKVVGRVA